LLQEKQKTSAKIQTKKDLLTFKSQHPLSSERDLRHLPNVSEQRDQKSHHPHAS
jgi:hypothetical protein